MTERVTLILATVWFLAHQMRAGGISYEVTLNAAACHDVHLGGFSIPQQSKGLMFAVDSGHCHYEVRSGREAELYVGVLCVGGGPVPGQGTIWPSARQKFAVDLNRAPKVRRIDETTWSSAPVLQRSDHGGLPQDEQGARYKGHLFAKSGPSWYGEGFPSPVPARLSQSGSRVAVYSWNGIDEAHDVLDLTSVFQPNHVKGHFWVDMYDTASAEPLIKIAGSFRNAEPEHFLGQWSTFYSERYYIMPVGHANGDYEFNLAHLLICDVDGAARKDNNLKQRK